MDFETRLPSSSYLQRGRPLFSKNLHVRPSLVQIHRLGNSAASLTRGRVLRDVGEAGEKVGVGSLWAVINMRPTKSDCLNQTLPHTKIPKRSSIADNCQRFYKSAADENA
jgi:hypothetical protein